MIYSYDRRASVDLKGWIHEREDSYHRDIRGVRVHLIAEPISGTAFLSITSKPKALSYSEWLDAEDQMQVEVPLAHVDREAEALAARYRALRGPRTRRAPSGAQLKVWQGDAAREALEAIRKASARGKALTTKEVVWEVLDNRLVTLEGADRRYMARAIRAMLEGLARKGTIVKDSESARQIMWLVL